MVRGLSLHPEVARLNSPQLSQCGSGLGPSWAGNRTGLDAPRTLRAAAASESDREDRQNPAMSSDYRFPRRDLHASDFPSFCSSTGEEDY